MFRTFQKAFRPSPNDSLSAAFSRLGWLGFWMQVAVGLIPLALTIYALVFGRNPAPGTRAGFPLIEYLSIAGLLVLAFTTMWSYRYTRLAVRLADPARRPDGVDRHQGKHGRDPFLDDRHVFRSRTTFDLFSSRTPGGNSGDSDHGRAGKLGVRRRHRRVDGPPPHNVR